MKVSLNFGGFKISSQGMGIQRKKMDLVAENIANIETTKTKNGGAYQRKYLRIQNESGKVINNETESSLALRTTDEAHIPFFPVAGSNSGNVHLNNPKIEMSEVLDTAPGNMIYQPDHPDANKDGYVLMPNVNIVTEMVDMIAATRGYEANVTAFNASKEIAKTSLDI